MTRSMSELRVRACCEQRDQPTMRKKARTQGSNLKNSRDEFASLSSSPAVFPVPVLHEELIGAQSDKLLGQYAGSRAELDSVQV